MSRTRGVGRTGRLHVTVTDSRGRPHALARWLGPWLEQHAPLAARGTVALALVTDARMRVLNRTFRKVDRATDVLSFPSAGDAPAGLETDRSNPVSAPKTRALSPSQATSHKSQAPRPKPQAPSHLGDLGIAMGVAARQARAEGHDVVTELRILALHGLLHLLGYDHERDRGTMRTVEDRLRRRAGLPAGLITRTPKRPLLK
jgi:probable rRNA maturation factor